MPSSYLKQVIKNFEKLLVGKKTGKKKLRSSSGELY